MKNPQEIRSAKLTERAFARITRMKQAATELTEELGLSSEVKYDVLSEMYDQEFVPPEIAEEVKSSAAESLSSGHFDKENEVKLTEEAELVQQVSQGNPAALLKLYEAHIESIYRFCYSWSGNVSEAEDVVSETFKRALKVLLDGHYTGQDKSFDAFLRRIAEDVQLERNRKIQQGPTVEQAKHLLEDNESMSEQ